MASSADEPDERLAGNLRPDAFAGTAEAYLRYRPPYPKALMADLMARARPPRDGVLLDLACGPGRIALDLAPRFARVVALDLEPEMIAVGRVEATRRDLANLDWRVGRAEDLELPRASVDLITVGEAFHRLDQRAVLAKAQGWLKPGGGIATLGAAGPMSGAEPWAQCVAEVARHWTAKAFPSGVAQSLPGAATTAEGIQQVIRDAGFIAVESHEFGEPRSWSFTEILGWLSSSSVCSERALGGEFQAFAEELRQALAGHPEPFRGVWDAAYTFGRKP